MFIFRKRYTSTGRVETQFLSLELKMNNTTIVILILLLVVIVVAFLAWNYSQRRTSQNLQEKFGPEYQHTVETYGDQRRAEEALASREKRVKALGIHPMPQDVRARLAQQWQTVQEKFVDDPSSAVRDADSLVTEAMNACGYPMGDFEQRAADISVDHPLVVSNYRSARDIAMANRQGKATTEQMRQALVHYRALFDDLLATTYSANEKEKVRS